MTHVILRVSVKKRGRVGCSGRIVVVAVVVVVVAVVVGVGTFTPRAQISIGLSGFSRKRQFVGILCEVWHTNPSGVVLLRHRYSQIVIGDVSVFLLAGVGVFVVGPVGEICVRQVFLDCSHLGLSVCLFAGICSTSKTQYICISG
jgi:hypothetical protein